MRRLIVTLDDDFDKVLAGKPNQAEYIREALRLYHSDITTDTLAGMRQAFIKLSRQMDDMQQRFVEQYEMVERLTRTMDDLSNR